MKSRRRNYISKQVTSALSQCAFLFRPFLFRSVFVRSVLVCPVLVCPVLVCPVLVCPVALLTLALFASPSLAAPIYRFEGPDGKVIYSSKPPTKDAKAADLPPIMRAQMKLPKQDQISCAPHGGANCQLGPDTDGSVICYDGFRGAANRYRFTCNTPKLEISDISELTREGNFSVFVRNSRSVKAAAPSVIFKPEYGTSFKLSGPNEIEPFGLAEFIYQAPANVAETEVALLQKPDLTQLDVVCGNCP